ncbi:MAG: hypothetical protein U0Q03_03545 [Acidimicrobiales bacterium]
MGKIILLAVAAAWAAVLLPPLLRSRMENRPGSSVTDFRRQLSTLQRAVPTRSMTPMRSMARPLAPSPLQRPAATGRPGHVQGFQRTSVDRTSGLDRASLDRAYERYGYDRADRADRADRGFERADRYDRSHGEVGYSSELRGRYQREHRADREPVATSHAGHAAHRSTHVRRPSQREVVRRRRANVLFVLVMANALTLFLAATTKSSAMVYAFALAFVSLCGYCYKLAQLRQYEQSPATDAHWYHAA